MAAERGGGRVRGIASVVLAARAAFRWTPRPHRLWPYNGRRRRRTVRRRDALQFSTCIRLRLHIYPDCRPMRKEAACLRTRPPDAMPTQGAHQCAVILPRRRGAIRGRRTAGARGQPVRTVRGQRGGGSAPQQARRRQPGRGRAGGAGGEVNAELYTCANLWKFAGTYGICKVYCCVTCDTRFLACWEWFPFI